MTNITGYSDKELSIIVMNEEYYYNERHNVPYLKALIDEEFEYTPEQMQQLESDLEDEKGEE